MSRLYVTSSWKATGVPTHADPTLVEMHDGLTEKTQVARLVGAAVVNQLQAVRAAHQEVGRHEIQFTLSFT